MKKIFKNKIHKVKSNDILNNILSGNAVVAYNDYFSYYLIRLQKDYWKWISPTTRHKDDNIYKNQIDAINEIKNSGYTVIVFGKNIKK